MRIKNSAKLKLNEIGKRKVAAWLLYHGNQTLDQESIFRRAEAAVQVGKKSIVLAKEEADRHSRYLPEIRLTLNVAWFEP